MDYDSDAAELAEAMAAFYEAKATENEEFGFSMYPVGMTTEEITRENIPTWWDMDAKDYSCIIFHIGVNWDIDGIACHFGKPSNYPDVCL